MQPLQKHISIIPEIRFGKPCIKGTRITVSDILKWLSSGMTYEDILEDYPQLTKEQLLAAIQFAARKEELIHYIGV